MMMMMTKTQTLSILEGAYKAINTNTLLNAGMQINGYPLGAAFLIKRSIHTHLHNITIYTHSQAVGLETKLGEDLHSSLLLGKGAKWEHGLEVLIKELGGRPVKTVVKIPLLCYERASMVTGNQYLPS